MKTMRKIIAVLAAALMLCSVVPMGVLAAPGDVVLDKNFDSDNGGFERAVAENGYIVFDATTADWQNTYAYVNGIKAGTNYKVTFQAKANKECKMNFKVNNNWTGDVFAQAVDVTTEWQDYEIAMSDLALTASAVVMFTSGYEDANAPIYYIDNLKIVEVVDPALIGKVVNGDFETGNKTGWETHQSTVIDAAAAHNGSYGAHLKGNGSWGGMLNQTIYATPGKTYEITLSVKVIASGVNVQIVDGNSSGEKLASGWFDKNAAGEWTIQTFLVSPATESIFINFCGGGNGVAEEVYVDDVSARELKDPSFDGYITNGDFETGSTAPWDIYGTTAVIADAANSGDYGMMLSGGGASYGGIANQDFTVEVGKTYVVRFDMKVVNAGINVQVKNAGANVSGGYISKTEWATYSYEFTATATNSNLNFCGSGIAGTDVAYLDNILVYEKVEQSNDGYLINGTFDTGDLAPWDNLWGSCPTAEVIVGGKDSTFALYIVSGQWKHVRQLPIAVEANTDYRITVWGKNVKDMNLLVKDNGDTTNVANVAINGGEEWTENIIEFNSGSYTSILVSFMGGSENACGTFDNIVMECLAPACEHAYEYDCSKVCNLCGEESRPEAAHGYFYACDQYCNLCGEKTNAEAAHNKIHVEAKDAVSCVEYGNVEYWHCEICGTAWLDEAGRMQTSMMSVRRAGACVSDAEYPCQDGECINCGLPCAAEVEHEYFYACDQYCMNCGELTNEEAAHNIIHVEAKDPISCTEPGNIEYWYCEHCGSHWDNADAAGIPLNAMMVKVWMEHEYFYACDQRCTMCGELTNEEAAHSIVHVEAVEAADCRTMGNIEYWYCEHCGSAWADEAQTIVTNMMSVRTGYGDHIYDDDYDVDCNVCGDIREVTLPVTIIAADGTSIAENNNSLAFRFVIKATDAGLEQVNKYVEGSAKVIPFNNGVEYTLVRMGTIVSNRDDTVLDLEHLDGRRVINSPVVRLYSVDEENGDLSFATRVINIPNVGKDAPISTRPYYVYEKDGIEIVVYGDTVTTSYEAAKPIQ